MAHGQQAQAKDARETRGVKLADLQLGKADGPQAGNQNKPTLLRRERRVGRWLVGTLDLQLGHNLKNRPKQ